MRRDEPWSVVEIEVDELEYPISTREFLKLRAVPIELSRQFKATAGQGRHVQEVPLGTADQFRTLGAKPQLDETELRRFSLVRADDQEDGTELLASAGREPAKGDLAFLVTDNVIAGLFESDVDGNLTPRPEREVISRDPSDVLEIVERAVERRKDSDNFKGRNANAGASDLVDFVESDDNVRDVEQFKHFYDRFVIFPRKLSHALEIAARPVPAISTGSTDDEEPEDDDGGEEIEQIEAESLAGLTSSAVEAQMEDVKLPRSVLAEAVTALRSGKHLLLSGPPGTGKSRLAAALARAVVVDRYDIATATADWTTFDTIGGYIPQEKGQLEFESGIVLRALRRGNWLIIDELNRADIDKAFGPLFTLLSGGGDKAGGQDVVLPFKRGDKNVRIVWSASLESASSRYAVTTDVALDRDNERSR